MAIVVLSILLTFSVLLIFYLLYKVWYLNKKNLEIKQQQNNNLDPKAFADIMVKFQNISNKVLNEQTNITYDKIKETLKPYTDKVKEITEDLKKYDEQNKINYNTFFNQLNNIKQVTTNFETSANKFLLALKSSSKKQGIFGEDILYRILDDLGFKENFDYIKQKSSKNLDSDTNNIFDILIKLPSDSTGNDSNVIIDSKTPLNSYIEWTESTDKVIKDQLGKDFIRHLKKHVNDLSKKNYEQTDQTLDFVILFLPFEGANDLIWQYDKTLLTEAYKKNISILTPSSLILGLKLIFIILKRHNGMINAKDLVKLGNEIYRFSKLYIKDIEKIQDASESLNKNINHLVKNTTESGPKFKKLLEKLENSGFDNKIKPGKVITNIQEVDLVE